MFKTVIENLGGWGKIGANAVLVAIISAALHFIDLDNVKSNRAFAIITDDNVQLRQENQYFRKQVLQLQTSIAERDLSLNILTSTRGNEPIIAWAKDRDGNYIEFNRAFEDKILIPQGLDPDQVLYHNDLEIWEDSSLAKIYRMHDREVMRTRRLHEYREFLEFDGHRIPFISAKYPLFIGNRVMGTAGQAYEDCE